MKMSQDGRCAEKRSLCAAVTSCIPREAQTAPQRMQIFSYLHNACIQASLLPLYSLLSSRTLTPCLARSSSPRRVPPLPRPFPLCGRGRVLLFAFPVCPPA